MFRMGIKLAFNCVKRLVWFRSQSDIIPSATNWWLPSQKQEDKSYFLSNLLTSRWRRRRRAAAAASTKDHCQLRCVQDTWPDEGTRNPREELTDFGNSTLVFSFNNIVIKGTTSSTTSPASSGVNNIVDSLSKSSQQEEELLGLAGFEQLLRAKPDPTCLWDLASKKDLVLTKSIHTVGWAR